MSRGIRKGGSFSPLLYRHKGQKVRNGFGKSFMCWMILLSGEYRNTWGNIPQVKHYRKKGWHFVLLLVGNIDDMLQSVVNG